MGERKPTKAQMEVVADFHFYAARMQAKRELGDALWNVLYPEQKS